MVLTRKTIGKTICRTIKIFPFILFTFVINGILDNWVNALWIGVKLILVCNITVVYANTTSIMRSCRNDPIIMHTFETIKHSTRRDKNNGMYVFIDDSNFKKDLRELKEACKAKNMKWNIPNMKFIFSRFFLSLIQRVNQIEEALIAKGYSS